MPPVLYQPCQGAKQLQILHPLCPVDFMAVDSAFSMQALATPLAARGAKSVGRFCLGLPEGIRSSPTSTAAPPPKTYRTVSGMNRSVKVRLIWPAAEWDALIPTISTITPVVSRTNPKIHCILKTGSKCG